MIFNECPYSSQCQVRSNAGGNRNLKTMNAQVILQEKTVYLPVLMYVLYLSTLFVISRVRVSQVCLIQQLLLCLAYTNPSQLTSSSHISLHASALGLVDGSMRLFPGQFLCE